MPDAHKNFAISSVATAPSPASSGTSLVVSSGHGTRFPAVPFNATVWASGSFPDPDNAEIVRVTGISTDTLTIVRTQESTSARSILVGDFIAATVTNKTLTEAEQSDGWIIDPATWTYVSATSFKVSGVDVTAQFAPGTRVRLKQGGGYKYLNVTASTFSTDTTITTNGGSDYSLANASITDTYYSYAETPQGWPTWFNYAPTIVGWGTPSTTYARFSVLGKMYRLDVAVTGTSNSTSTSFTLPITLATSTDMPFFPAMIRNSGTYAIGRMGSTSSTTTVTCGLSGTSDTWTATGAKEIYYYQTLKYA